MIVLCNSMHMPTTLGPHDCIMVSEGRADYQTCAQICSVDLKLHMNCLHMLRELTTSQQLP